MDKSAETLREGVTGLRFYKWWMGMVDRMQAQWSPAAKPQLKALIKTGYFVNFFTSQAFTFTLRYKL